MPLRYSFILFIFLLSQACTTTSLSSKTESSICRVDSRNPASINCEELFKDDHKAPQTFVQAISRLPDYFSQLKKQHSFNEMISDSLFVRSYYDQVARRHHPIGASLFEELTQGSKPAQVYIKLGFHQGVVSDSHYFGPQQDRDHISVLLPPINIADVYQRIYELIGNEQSDIRDSILPALVFEKEAELNGETVKEYILSRPGIDDIPREADGWKFVVRADLPDKIFFKNASEGKMPFEMKMFHHDLAHILDYILHPKLASLHRKYFKRELDVAQASFDGEIQSLKHQYLIEFLSFSDPNQKSEWDHLIGSRSEEQWLSQSNLRVNELLAEFDNHTLKNRIKAFEDFYIQGTLRYGGGSNDGRARYVFPYSRGGITSILSYKANGKSIPRSSSPQKMITQESLWGIVLQMTYLQEVLAENRDPYSHWNENRPTFSAAEIDAVSAENKVRLRLYLAELVESFERKIYWSNHYNMTAEKLFTDLLSNDFTKADSYQYYLRVSAPESLEYKFFIEGQK